jgi:hypothetical protein
MLDATFRMAVESADTRSLLAANDSYDAAHTGAVGVHASSSGASSQERSHVNHNSDSNDCHELADAVLAHRDSPDVSLLRLPS